MARGALRAPMETVYSTPDGKVYRESSSRKSEVSSVDKERYIYVPPQPDLLIGGGDGPGGEGSFR